MNKYYVYVFLREDRYTPYYVGKGTGHRMYQRNGRVILPPTDKTRIVKVKDNLTEKQSFDLERTLIRFWGRKTDGGVLHNLTEGGEGCSGLIHTDETKQKMSDKKKGIRNDLIYTEERNKKISQSRRGIDLPPETREKISQSLIGNSRRKNGKKTWKPDQEYKDNMSRIMKGKGKGRKFTEEHRRKLSEAAKRQHENRRRKSQGD